jgi:uncharacterized membrane protein YiaA
METSTFIEAFNLAFELVVKWVFFASLFLLLIGFVVFSVAVWKAISGETEQMYYPGCC